MFASFVAAVQSLPSYQKRMVERKKLPAWAERDQVLAHMQEAQVVVISGMTGWVHTQGRVHASHSAMVG